MTTPQYSYVGDRMDGAMDLKYVAYKPDFEGNP